MRPHGAKLGQACLQECGSPGLGCTRAQIEATVLFADVTAFSARTADLDPTETLTFVNNFFCWITAEALRGRPGRAATSAET